jgi:hypothetical protein
MELVDDRAVDVQAVHGGAVGGQRHEAGGGRGDVQVVDQDADPALQRRRRANHSFGLVEHDPRLVAGCGGGVDLRAVLAVGDQQVQSDAGRERALAVLPRERAVGGAEAAQPIWALPAEQAADHERLPGREREGLPGPLTFAVAKKPEELESMARRGGIEAQAACGAVGQILEMALAGQTDETVGEHLSLGHSLRVGGDRVVSGRPSHGPAGRSRRDPRRSARRPGSGCASSGSCRTRTLSAP